MPTLTLTTEQLIDLQRKCEQTNCAGPSMVWFEEFMGYRITPLLRGSVLERTAVERIVEYPLSQ